MAGPVTNDTARLAPRIPQGGRVLSFDFPGLEVGVAGYAEGPTGCTVLHFPKVASMQIDVRGGSPGINGEYLTAINAICFAGGSLYGLEASTGVAAELFAKRGHSTKWMDIALVSGAIIFDYGRRQNAVYPDKELGRAAVRMLRRWLALSSRSTRVGTATSDPLQLRSIARQVHSSTQTVDDPALDEVSLGVVASELAWDAVLACYDE